MEEQRRGDYITTYTGLKFWPLDPRQDEVSIVDIAHALSNAARFAGHLMRFYSVAQHSVLVSMMCPPELQLWGLLHDASEAYLTDVPSPVKRDPGFAFYREAETHLMNVICDVFGLTQGEPTAVKLVDNRMTVTEARDMRIDRGRTMGMSAVFEPYDFNIVPWDPLHAENRFLARFHELARGI